MNFLPKKLITGPTNMQKRAIIHGLLLIYVAKELKLAAGHPAALVNVILGLQGSVSFNLKVGFPVALMSQYTSYVIEDDALLHYSPPPNVKSRCWVEFVDVPS